jgi:probable addiction module antidote protein
MKKMAAFDVADYLDSDEVVAEFLSAALEDPDPDVFLMAVADVAKAKGMSHIASAAGLGRESLYKALSPGAKPRYDTVLRVLRALGVQLHRPCRGGGRLGPSISSSPRVAELGSVADRTENVHAIPSRTCVGSVRGASTPTGQSDRPCGSRSDSAAGRRAALRRSRSARTRPSHRRGRARRRPGR